MFLDTHLGRKNNKCRRRPRGYHLCNSRGKPINFDMLVVAVEDESRQKMKFHHVEFGDLSSRSE